jgi:glucokinase
MVLALDIGGTLTKIGLVSREGSVLRAEVFKTGAMDPFVDFIGRVQQVFAKWKELPGMNPVAMGIGAPNASSLTGCMENPPNFKWGKRIPLLDALTEKWNLPAYLTNDANAAALGEMYFGVARGLEHFVTLTLGTGLGSGIVSHGKLLTGSRGMAGEIGHINVFPEGRQCKCGLKGCLETYASVTGIRRTVMELIAEGGAHSLLSAYSFDELQGLTISQAALQGDPIAIKAYEFTGKILGLKMADTAAHLDPEAFIISGGLSQAGDLLLNPIRKSMEARLFRAYRGKIAVLTTEYSSEEAVLGPAALAWQHLEKGGV